MAARHYQREATLHPMTQVVKGKRVESKYVTLHLYAARPNLGYRPLYPLDLFTVAALQTFVVPRSLAAELNLFAGQLYF